MGTPRAHDVVAEYGARNDGTEPADGRTNRQRIQAAVDAIAADGGGTLHFPPGRYRLGGEVELRADRMRVELGAATIAGAPGVPNVEGLLTVVDRRDLRRTIQHVWVDGGLFVPAYRQAGVSATVVGTNALCVAAGRYVTLRGCHVDLRGGLRGICIQTDATFGATAHPDRMPIRHVTISDCIVSGGDDDTNAIDIEALPDAGAAPKRVQLIADVTLANCVVEGSGQALRVDAGGTPVLGPRRDQDEAVWINGLSISNLTIAGARRGIWWKSARRSSLSHVLIDGVAGPGIDAMQPEDCLWSDIYVRASAGQELLGPGIAVSETTPPAPFTNGSEGRLSLRGFTVVGPFAHGLFNATWAGRFGDGTIVGARVGLYTHSEQQRSVYRGITFQNCGSAMNARRDADVYTDLTVRDSARVRSAP